MDKFEELSTPGDPNTVLSELLESAYRAEKQGYAVDEAVEADLLTAARFVHTEDISQGGDALDR